ncbi:type VI secretion system tube protein Hcp [uncultured Sphingorhabdus sp.]|uniref:type VI secretion system tube protein Hcp n=1 Tax=uncultured Sphingorhabdus sp. TaxID=1686106 RepID=UPI0026378E3F|nr:type VI secretion system tube protein Hcp [uncultured Sphingorhabdus sp.]HMS21317.1 type VI secretion system tube protein Hcp [Sphingorhabdus sp.]
MTYHLRRKSAALACALAAITLNAPAYAASTDYYLKLGGVDGESKDTKTREKGHKNWTDLSSLRLVEEESASGGVHVATGDVNGDGTADRASGQATGKRSHEPLPLRAATDAETAALLLPAVQKVREAAARMPAWRGCAAGQKIESLAIKQKSTGRMGRILDATVSQCASEQVSFNFTKIEWD